MPDTPTPLREALREAVKDVIVAENVHARSPTMPNAQQCSKVRDRVDALLSQIPIVFETREAMVASKPEKMAPEEIEQAISYLQKDIAELEQQQYDATRDFEAQKADLWKQIKELRDLLSGDGR